MDICKDDFEKSEYFQPNFLGLPSKISWHIRKQMYDALMRIANLNSKSSILDVGVTSDRRRDCNFFEKLYPYPHQIVAIGTEDAYFLEQDYPGLKFIKCSGPQLPFKDKSFDLVLSFATIEHVGNRESQKAFLDELCRVAKACCVTTPNRWYPLEFHTLLPLVHWLPPRWFRFILKRVGKEFFADEKNLNLLTSKNVIDLLSQDTKLKVIKFKLLGLVSNLMFYIENHRLS